MLTNKIKLKGLWKNLKNKIMTRRGLMMKMIKKTLTSTLWRVNHQERVLTAIRPKDKRDNRKILFNFQTEGPEKIKN
jgi:hypothetical protein